MKYVVKCLSRGITYTLSHPVDKKYRATMCIATALPKNFHSPQHAAQWWRFVNSSEVENWQCAGMWWIEGPKGGRYRMLGGKRIR